MGVEKILIVNDDVEDIVSIQQRLPEGVEVEAASQDQARYWGVGAGVDLVILDNDANNREKSIGAETLVELRKKMPDIPILYTSFQPGWVEKSVMQTVGVEVVKTDELLELLSNEYGLQLKPVQKQKVENVTEPMLNIMLTYNDVEGYPEDMYGTGKLLVVSFDKHAGAQARNVLKKRMDMVYENFEFRKDRDKIRNIFVYDGIASGEEASRVAATLGHDIRMQVHLMACGCNWQRKKQFQGSHYVDLHQVECGGSRSLGRIADVIMGIKRPGVNYDNLPISVAQINAVSEKFRM